MWSGLIPTVVLPEKRVHLLDLEHQILHFLLILTSGTWSEALMKVVTMTIAGGTSFAHSYTCKTNLGSSVLDGLIRLHLRKNDCCTNLNQA